VVFEKECIMRCSSAEWIARNGVPWDDAVVVSANVEEMVLLTVQLRFNWVDTSKRYRHFGRMAGGKQSGVEGEYGNLTSNNLPGKVGLRNGDTGMCWKFYLKFGLLIFQVTLRQLTYVNTLWTGDENSRFWRFFFTTVKDRWRKFAF
jgi:hypothetical protein